MKQIKQHIKENKYLPFYLIYGTEDYLIKLYRDKLKFAMGFESADLNYSYFEGKGFEISELVSIAHTLPFFAERRLIVVQNSGLFQNQNELTNELTDFPDSTFVVFVETEVDRRGRLYKFVKANGYACEINRLRPDELQLFVISELKKNKKKMTESTVRYFLDRVGADLYLIQNELEKVISYCIDREMILEEEVAIVCTAQIENRIFVMMEAIGLNNLKRALELYFDLIVLREKPLVILYLMIRHFNKLLQIDSLKHMGFSDREIAEKAAIPTFALSAYVRQCKNFSRQQLKDALEYGTELEFCVKSGQIDEQIAVEIMIAKSAMM